MKSALDLAREYLQKQREAARLRHQSEEAFKVAEEQRKQEMERLVNMSLQDFVGINGIYRKGWGTLVDKEGRVLLDVAIEWQAWYSGELRKEGYCVLLKFYSPESGSFQNVSTQHGYVESIAEHMARHIGE